MAASLKQQFIAQIKSFEINTKYAVIKPNWVSNEPGEFTEPEILNWLLEALPNQEKIVIESYTPWRGLKFAEADSHKGEGVTLSGGKTYWDFYKKQDEFFLKSTGIGEILKKHNAKYINITNEVWAQKCVKSEIIKNTVENKREKIKWQELYSYIPQSIFNIRDQSTLISLSKIKVEESIPVIQISMSIKNLFGLIPHPSRWIPFHGKNHETVPEVIHDIYTIYSNLFNKTLWITEGIKSLIRNYCEPDQKIVKNQKLFFIGTDAKKVDTDACKIINIDPLKVPHLMNI